MAMISGGDESARNAFRAYLRDDSSQLSIISTEEMSPGDVLEVKNLADAIERAERVMKESSRPRDMFAELGGSETATDDASGPAVYAKPTLTPVPPSLANVMATPLPLPPAAPATLSTQPLPAILYVPNNEEDAFLQPAGRMRHFAEETLDGYRPDSTMEIRLKGAGERRKTFTVVIGALLAVLAVAVVASVVIALMPKAEAQAETSTNAKVDSKPVPAPVVEKASPPKAEAKTESVSSVPTMNVNDLPSAR